MACDVVVDAVGILGGGGRQVAFDTITALAQDPRISKCHIFVTDPGLYELLLGLDSITCTLLPMRGLIWRAWWWTYGFDREVRRIGNVSSLCLANVCLKRAPRGSAVLVHQPNALEVPEELHLSMLERLRFRLLKALIRRSTSVADVVLVQTDAVRDALLRCCNGRVLAEIVVALPHPPSIFDSLSPASDMSNNSPLIVFIGSDAPHKNLNIIYRAAPKMAEHFPDVRFALTVDSPTPSSPGNIDFLGSQDRQAVWNLLSSASVLVMPSYTETVGLPMIEALSVGVPVVAADRPYAHAICDDAAIYFDPNSPDSLVSAISRVLGDDRVYADLRTKGVKRLKMFEEDSGVKWITDWFSNL